MFLHSYKFNKLCNRTAISYILYIKKLKKSDSNSGILLYCPPLCTVHTAFLAYARQQQAVLYRFL